MLIDARLPDSEAGVPVGLDGRWLEQGALSLAREQYAQALRLAAGALRHARRGDARQAPSEASRDAAVFIAWSLYQMRRYQGCRRWLRYTLKTGLTEPDNLECDIIALWLLSEEGDHEQVLSRTERALRPIRDQVSRAAADYLFLRGRALTRLGRLDEAGEALESAAAVFRLTGCREKQALVCGALGLLHMQQCRYAAARAWLERSKAINQELDLPGRLARTRLNLAILGYRTGQYQAAKQDCEEALAEFTRLGLSTSACRARLALSIIERIRGEFPAARRHLMEAHTVARRLRLQREKALVMEFLGDVFRDEGRPTEARRYYARGLAVARAIAPEGDLMVELLRRDGECRVLQGRPREALATLDEALALAHRLGDRLEEGVVQRCRASALAACGEEAAALALIEQAITLLQEIEAPHEAAIAHLLAARLLAAPAGNAAP